MLAVAEWSLGNALELGALDLSAKIFWAKIEYLGIVTLPLAWLTFSLQFANRTQWLTRRNLILLAIVPFITLLLVWTNELGVFQIPNPQKTGAGKRAQAKQTNTTLRSQ